MKPTLADLVRLLQIEKELDADEPREVRVRWIEPAATENLLKGHSYKALPSQQAFHDCVVAIQGLFRADRFRQEPGIVPRGDQAFVRKQRQAGPTRRADISDVTGCHADDAVLRFLDVKLPYEYNKAENMLTMRDTGRESYSGRWTI
jgi:hypothetical protein